MKFFNIQRLLIVSGLTFGSLFLSTNAVEAADLTVQCNLNSCTSAPLGQTLFTETNVVPGDLYLREVNVCNNANESLTFALEVSNFVDSSPSIGQVMNFKIIDAQSLMLTYGPVSLANLSQQGYILISGISANTCRDYSFVVSFENVGNEYQQKTLVFDLGFGFDAVPGITPTPTSTPALTPTPVPGSVLGEQATPTPIPTSSPESGNVLAATGIILIIPLLVGLFLILSASTVSVPFRNR